MIKNKYTDFVIEDPNEIISMPNHIKAELKGMDQDNHFVFLVPVHIEDNALKTVYKLGWLKHFYTQLYPKYSAVQIYREINQRWQIFVGIRQMERLWLKYVEIYQEKEED